MADPKIRYDILANAEGSESVDRLATELTKLDAAIDPAAAARAQALATQLRELGQQQAAVDTFVKLKEQTAGARTELEKAQTAAQTLGQRLADVEAPTRAEVGQMAKLKDAVSAAKAELQSSTAALDASRGKLTELGIATDSVASKEVELRTALRLTRAEVADLGGQQLLVQRFKELATSTEQARASLVAADEAVEAFKREITSAGEPTRQEALKLASLAEAARQAQIAAQANGQAFASVGAELRNAGVNTDKLLASQRSTRTELTATATAAKQLGSSYRSTAADATLAAGQQATAHRSISSGVKSISEQLDSLKNISIAGILGSQSVQLLKSVGETADAYKNLSARIKLVTGDGEAFHTALDGVIQVALRTNSSLDSTATLFTRIAQAGKEIGLGQKAALQLTESINQAIQLSGGSAEAADAAVTQLIQGLQSGVLRGEEFNSVMEQAPRLAQALAAGLGVTTGALRALANEGKLTTATVIQSLQSQRDALEKDFGQLPQTVGRAITNLGTQWTKFIGELSASSGQTSIVANGINLLANNLDKVAGMAARAGTVIVAALAVQAATALRAYAVEATAAAGATNLLALSIDKVPKTINIVVAAVGLEVGYQIGEMLYNNSALARKLGIGLVGFFEELVSELQFLAEAAAAVFTSDTVDAAFERFKARSKEIQDSFDVLMEHANEAPKAIASAVNQATDATQALGATATVAGGQVNAAGAHGASGVGGVSKSADTAQEAILQLAKAANVNLPTIGVTASQQASALAGLAAKSSLVAQSIGTELPAAIKKLSGPELNAFRVAFTTALEGAITSSRRLAESLGAAGQSTGPALADAQAKAAILKQILVETGKAAAQALGVDVVAAGNTLSDEFVKAEENLSVLVRSLPALKAAGVDTASVVSQAFQKLIDGARSNAELEAIKARIQALGAAGQITGDQVAGAFALIATKAEEIKAKIEDATPGIQSLGEAARKAGVDFGELTTGLSVGFRQSVVDVGNLVDQISKSSVAAERASPILAKAFDQRLAVAATKEEIDLLTVEVNKARDSGKLLGDDYANAFDKIKSKANEISPAFQQLQRDAKAVGVTISTETTRGVDQALTAYERLKSSGKLSADQLQTAFVNTANEIIKANGGIVPEFIKVEAATRGVTIAVDSLGNACVTLGSSLNQAAAGMDAFGISARNAATDAKEAAAEIKSAADTAALGDIFTKSFNSSPQTLLRKQQSGTLSGDDLAAAQENYSNALANLSQAQRNGTAVSGAGLASLQAEYNQARAILDQITSPTVGGSTRQVGNGTSAGNSLYGPNRNSNPTVTNGTTVHKVQITVPGSATETVNTNSASDANALIRSLESVARSAGSSIRQ